MEEKNATITKKEVEGNPPLSHSVVIFTDGSSRGNPGPGGYAAVIVYDEKVTELGGREEHTTNNRMELQAAIEALKFVQNQGSTRSDLFPDLRSNLKNRTLILYSDSSYVVNGITKWVFGWQKNNWITATKKPVENRDLWEELFDLARDRKIEWKQVGGHVGVAGNERCDVIAQTYAELTPTDAEKKLKLYNGLFENYPIKNILNVYDISYKKQEAKTASRTRQKTKAYSYVSQVDGKIMTHKTWAECEARVKGKPAKFKKSVSAEDEKKVIAEFSSGV